MSRIVVSILCYNSEMFIKYTLDGIYDFADKVVIVEGSYGLQRAFGKRSTDKTVEMIKNYPDPKKKITLLHMNGKEREHRDKVLTYCKPGDWFFTVHTDEFYKKEHLKYLRNLLDNDKVTDVIKIPWFEFYYNFHLGIDNTYSSSRIYRVKEGCRFIRKDQMGTKDGNKYLDLNAKFLDKKNIQMFHYAYVYNVRKKIAYYGKNRLRWYKEIFTQYAPENAGDIYKKNEKLTGKYGIHPTGEESCVITEFKGEHPEVMRDHPLNNWDLLGQFKKGYKEPEYEKGNIFNRSITYLKYLYYKRAGNV